jgi:mutator protein MutT
MSQTNSLIKPFVESSSEMRPYKQQVIVRVILRDGDKILLMKKHKRKDNRHSLPGGRVEVGEALKAALIRETMEEIGVQIQPKNLRLVHLVSSRDRRASYVHIYFAAQKWKGEIRNLEPEKCDSLHWVDISQLPDNFLPPNGMAIRKYLNNILYSEFNWNGS